MDKQRNEISENGVRDKRWVDESREEKGEYTDCYTDKG
jgi:hypothetical protein